MEKEKSIEKIKSLLREISDEVRKHDKDEDVALTAAFSHGIGSDTKCKMTVAVNGFGDPLSRCIESLIDEKKIEPQVLVAITKAFRGKEKTGARMALVSGLLKFGRD